jgi:hypothetical protein
MHRDKKENDVVQNKSKKKEKTNSKQKKNDGVKKDILFDWSLKKKKDKEKTE